MTYQRNVYEVTEEDGTRRFVYLLDETLDLDVDQYLKNGTDNQLERATEILEGEIVK